MQQGCWATGLPALGAPAVVGGQAQRWGQQVEQAQIPDGREGPRKAGRQASEETPSTQANKPAGASVTPISPGGSSEEQTTSEKKHGALMLEGSGQVETRRVLLQEGSENGAPEEAEEEEGNEELTLITE